jgi:Holliday junction resolvase
MVFMAPQKQSPSSDALYRIKRGLSGYVSYLAACEMNEAFSEYVLYEPTLRILTARGFNVKCEYACPGFERRGAGDHKKIDFVATGNNSHFAIEMKWARSKRLDVRPDIEKLKLFLQANDNAQSFLCIFGRKSFLHEISLNPSGMKEQGAGVYAEFGVTKYGCRTYEISGG